MASPSAAAVPHSDLRSWPCPLHPSHRGRGAEQSTEPPPAPSPAESQRRSGVRLGSHRRHQAGHEGSAANCSTMYLRPSLSTDSQLCTARARDALVQSPASSPRMATPMFLTPNKPAVVFPCPGHPQNKSRGWTHSPHHYDSKTTPGSPLMSSGCCLTLHHPPTAQSQLQAHTTVQHKRPVLSEPRAETRAPQG